MQVRLVSTLAPMGQCCFPGRGRNCQACLQGKCRPAPSVVLAFPLSAPSAVDKRSAPRLRPLYPAQLFTLSARWLAPLCPPTLLSLPLFPAWQDLRSGGGARPAAGSCCRCPCPRGARACCSSRSGTGGTAGGAAQRSGCSSRAGRCSSSCSGGASAPGGAAAA